MESAKNLTSNILDQIQSQLPEIWDNPTSDDPDLKPRYAHFIKKTVYNALERHGYSDPAQWARLYVSGSLTTYQYSPSSDCDVNIFVDASKLPEWSRAEMVGIMVGEVDGTPLPATTYPLQVFVMPHDVKPTDKYQRDIRSGYDIDNQRWIEPPDRKRVMDVKKEENAWYVAGLEGSDKMESLLKYEPQKAMQYFEQIHRRRQMDSDKGDFGPANIIYKFLDRNGLLDQIHRLMHTSAVDELGPRHEYIGEPQETWQNPEWQEQTKDWTYDDWQANRARRDEWDNMARNQMATGRITPEQAVNLGYKPDNHEQDTDWGAPKWGRWRPLPQKLYHVTTNLPGIQQAGRFLGPDELKLNGKGRGLGGGTQNTISFTDSPEVAENIRQHFLEAGDVASGRKTVQQLMDEARSGAGAQRPWNEELERSPDYQNLIKGTTNFHRYDLPDDHPLKADKGHAGMDLRTQEEWAQHGYTPDPDHPLGPMTSQHGPLYGGGQVIRPLTPEEHNARVFDWWRNPFLWGRSGAGGPDNPVFTGVDPQWFAQMDPSHVGTVEAQPVPNGHGYPVSSLNEWRVPTGDAVNITGINGQPYNR